MPTRTFHCWSPAAGEEEDGRDVVAECDGDAALDFFRRDCEENFIERDDVHVRDLITNRVVVFECRAEIRTEYKIKKKNGA